PSEVAALRADAAPNVKYLGATEEAKNILQDAMKAHEDAGALARSTVKTEAETVAQAKSFSLDDIMTADAKAALQDLDGFATAARSYASAAFNDLAKAVKTAVESGAPEDAAIVRQKLLAAGAIGTRAADTQTALGRDLHAGQYLAKSEWAQQSGK